MDFSIPRETQEEMGRFRAFLEKHLSPQLSQWYERGAVPRSFFSLVAQEGWFSFSFSEDRVRKGTALREALFAEEMAKISPGVAVAVLAHQDLGLAGLWLFGSPLLPENLCALRSSWRDPSVHRQYGKRGGQRFGQYCHAGQEGRWGLGSRTGPRLT